MKLAVFGPSYFKGEKYENYEYVSGVLDVVTTRYDAQIILTGGGDKGVEPMALRYAALNGMEADVTPPNIRRDGDRAFLVRNTDIIDKADGVLLFWDALDQKYAIMVKQCAQKNKPILVYGVE